AAAVVGADHDVHARAGALARRAGVGHADRAVAVVLFRAVERVGAGVVDADVAHADRRGHAALERGAREVVAGVGHARRRAGDDLAALTGVARGTGAGRAAVGGQRRVGAIDRRI